jgi:hypothetical protein
VSFHRVFFASIAVLALAFAFACSSSSSSTPSAAADAGGDGTVGGPGFDCNALRDLQIKSNCPKFDPVRYVSDCMATKAAFPATCQMQEDAYADCVLQQPPPPCTEDGNIDDSTPAACKAVADQLQSCD